MEFPCKIEATNYDGIAIELRFTSTISGRIVQILVPASLPSEALELFATAVGRRIISDILDKGLLKCS